MKLKEAEAKLKAAGISTAELDALVLAEFASGKDRSYLLAHPEYQIPGIRYQTLVEKRARRVPIDHLTGHKEFYGLDFIVSPEVLSPRPESEQIVDWAIKYAPKNSNLIDVGTGCGALAIAIAKNRPDLKVSATEISDAALKIARQNTTKHSVPIDLKKSNLWHKSDLWQKSNFSSKQFETVVANLPYLKKDAELTPEAAKEPGVALFGGDDGLDLYRKFFEQLPEHLAKGGFVFIESDPWQQPELIKIAGNAGLTLIEQSYFVLGFTFS